MGEVRTEAVCCGGFKCIVVVTVYEMVYILRSAVRVCLLAWL